MPQASAETDAAMEVHFGKETEDNQWEGEANKYLRELGVKEQKGMFYTTSEHYATLDKKAIAAIDYLCEEWDYGFLVDPSLDALGLA